MLIYKILRASEWALLRADGRIAGAPVDIDDGFVHFSTIDQVRETAARHFHDEDKLQLLAVDVETVAAKLTWEVSRGGDRFPHLYRELRLSDVTWAEPLPLEGGLHRFPPTME